MPTDDVLSAGAATAVWAVWTAIELGFRRHHYSLDGHSRLGSLLHGSRPDSTRSHPHTDRALFATSSSCVCRLSARLLRYRTGVLELVDPGMQPSALSSRDQLSGSH